MGYGYWCNCLVGVVVPHGVLLERYTELHGGDEVEPEPLPDLSALPPEARVQVLCSMPTVQRARVIHATRYVDWHAVQQTLPIPERMRTADILEAIGKETEGKGKLAGTPYFEWLTNVVSANGAHASMHVCQDVSCGGWDEHVVISTWRHCAGDDASDILRESSTSVPLDELTGGSVDAAMDALGIPETRVPRRMQLIMTHGCGY
eukprot:TRINITY_DN20897_c0_g2_i1.p1 TRINITY_DN20897_c0_g2~~TRINITY_DN20897_c0_g2_i1.p1  ORF type:complete len:205 (-),score=24.42 TRINITY_DN20897_c0_g2_i1:151-765(-)